MDDARTNHDRAVSEALGLIDVVEARVPAPYRVAVFEWLARSARPAAAAVAPEHPGVEVATAARGPQTSASEWVGVDLAHYAKALSGPGRLLAKALLTLEIVSSQVNAEWMTPAEIERFLVERARATHVYRTNVSNALRRAPGLVDRRRRGRAYEYRLTDAGRSVVERELAILGP